MNNEEKLCVYKQAMAAALKNKAALTSIVLQKAAQDAAAPQPKSPLEMYDSADKYLTQWGDKTFGAGGGNYVSTGAMMSGLGALYGLLFGDKKHGVLDSILHNALLFGGAGLGGQYLHDLTRKA